MFLFNNLSLANLMPINHRLMGSQGLGSQGLTVRSDMCTFSVNYTIAFPVNHHRR